MAISRSPCQFSAQFVPESTPRTPLLLLRREGPRPRGVKRIAGARDHALSHALLLFRRPESANFNQLALACDERWNEARSLLVRESGSRSSARWARDLATAARQAAKEADPEWATLSPGEIPRRCRGPASPETGVLSAGGGPGTPSRERTTSSSWQIENQGMLVLRGR